MRRVSSESSLPMHPLRPAINITKTMVLHAILLFFFHFLIIVFISDLGHPKSPHHIKFRPP